MNENAGPYKGQKRFDVRYSIQDALKEKGLYVDKKDNPMKVPLCEKSKDIIEPIMKPQWWVRMKELAEPALQAVRDGKIKIRPESAEKSYFRWLEDINDWCISRQLWWGHRIPVWYSADGDDACFGPDEEPPAGWTQDEDVLDTWFSSALWPFSTMGWPEDTADLRAYYPTTLLVTGYDILFFGVVRMMLFGLYAMDGTVPFETVVLHGLVRDASGKKMSKSKGNVIDPLRWIDAYGADAVRLSMLQGANPGADQAINEEWVVGARNFCNKLWNATRFALISGATVDGPLPSALDGPNAWILSRLQAVITEVDALYERYEFAKIADVLYHFAWDEVCDWYIELAKLSLGGPGADATRRVASPDGPDNDSLARSMYQSHTSSHAKWYSRSAILANSYRSYSASTSVATACSRDRIQASTVDSSVGTGPSTVAPLINANRVAFQSLLQKLRAPTTHCSLTAWSAPGFAPCSIDSRTASAPYWLIQSSGSMTLPRDLDIFLPRSSRTSPCNSTTRNGTAPSMAYRPNSIIRMTQKNKMS
jgi:hypothetical protein